MTHQMKDNPNLMATIPQSPLKPYIHTFGDGYKIEYVFMPMEKTTRHGTYYIEPFMQTFFQYGKVIEGEYHTADGNYNKTKYKTKAGQVKKFYQVIGECIAAGFKPTAILKGHTARRIQEGELTPQ